TATVTIDVAGVTDWQNPHGPLDVNGDGTVSTIDIVLLINLLNLEGSHPLAGIDSVPPPWVDTNGDGSVSAIDVVRVINWINLHGIAEGEQTILPPPTLAQQRAAYSADNVQATVMPRRTLETGPAQHRAGHQAVWQETGSQKPVWQEQVWQETVSQVTVWQEQSPAQHVQPPLATEASERPPSSAPWAELVDALLCEAAKSDDDWEDLLTPLRKPR
ncbi:MAG: dockerin type I domain-containing protein, partial [Pirellulaceae bacterium]|nr:dockerin type I domain-containing protein [Pirellulaceae bacterium]